jgi:cyclopropane fatty-acyl-phospholipid synthase-like methyltransferase
MTRIFSSPADGENPEIDLLKVEEFFLKRADKLKKGDLSYKQAIIYQDKDGGLAEARDIAEKQLLLPKLRLAEDDRLLDIGCGTGRWAEIVANRVGKYHGTDLVQDLVAEAAKRNTGANIKFSSLPCTAISLETLNESELFNKIICFGVLIYLNDSDIPKLMSNIVSVADSECLLLLREPVGVDSRLTIKEHFSEDMDQFYNAIYRTDNELISMCESVLTPAGFKLIEFEDVFKNAEYNNRVETKQKYFLFKRAK